MGFLFAILIAITTAAISPEYVRVLELVSKGVQTLSPRGNPLFLACPQGPPGVMGPTGFPGTNDLQDEQSIQEWKDRLHNQIEPPPYKCNVDGAAKFILDQLSHQLVVYNTTWPPGPPGPHGNKGYKASETLLMRLQHKCFPGTGLSVQCDFIQQIYDSYYWILREPPFCPLKLEGAMGARGNRGESGLKKIDIDELATLLC